MNHSGFFKRIIAFIIDLIFINIIVFLGGLVIYLLIDILFGEDSFLITLIIDIVLPLSGIAYFIFLQGIYGRTLGKKLMRLKVVNYPEGGSITVKQAFQRHSVDLFLVLLYVLITNALMETDYPDSVRDNGNVALLLLTPILILLWKVANCTSILLSNHCRALHDFLGNTIVIKNSSDPVCQEHVVSSLDT